MKWRAEVYARRSDGIEGRLCRVDAPAASVLVRHQNKKSGLSSAGMKYAARNGLLDITISAVGGGVARRGGRPANGAVIQAGEIIIGAWPESRMAANNDISAEA